MPWWFSSFITEEELDREGVPIGLERQVRQFAY